MKLKKIKDIRIGQIYQSKEDKDDIICIKGNNTFNKIIGYDDKIIKEDDLLKLYNLIGVLYITHKKLMGKYIEIERYKFEIDDIVEYDEKKYIITYANRAIDEDYTTYYINEIDNLENQTVALSVDLKKIGTLGVNYELINNNL